ncbi:MAG: ribonuclease R [Pseudomonadota bacterium]
MTEFELPTREDILRFIADSPGRVGKREIARAFSVKGADRPALKSLLADMADDGLIERSGKRLQKPGTLPRVTVLAIDGTTSDGEITATPTRWEGEGNPPKVIIIDHGRERPPAIGDRVLARISTEEDGPPTGKIMKVLERRPATTLAVVERVGGRAQLSPISKKERDHYQADPAQIAEIPSDTLVRITARRGEPAQIVEVIGPAGSEAAVSLIAIQSHGIPNAFPERVLAAAEAAREDTPTLKGREDWREIPFVTIDPPDAKDHDDAVFAEPDPDNEGGHIISVAIADVAHYVRPGSVMDQEARLRGNSTYFPDRVVPMLPEAISNNLCSLREGEARPAMAMRMVFARDGRKTRHTVHRVLMRSARRLAYAEAQAIADGKDSDIAPQIAALYAAYAVLKRGRDGRQPMELDLPERKIVLEGDGSVSGIAVPVRLDAHKLIEEFMIQANVAAAETAEAAGLPLLYRVHDAPSLQKVEGLREFLATLDIKLAKGTRLRPEHFNAILSRVAGTPQAQIVNDVVLRAQAQAEYAPDNLGHFGLNLRRYAHFTSPIRRYADLIVHRALIRAQKLGDDGLTDDEMAALGQIGADISATERRSMTAERETIDRLIAGWLKGSVGATFAGRIAGVTKAGLFIRLDDTGADGFVPVSTIAAEYLVYDETHHALIGADTGHAYRLGDPVAVRLLEAAPLSGGLRFEIVDHEAGPRIKLPPRSRRSPSPRRRPPPRRGRR